MNLFQNADNLLRRFLKRKVRVTDALVVAFLITGGIGFAASPDQAGEDVYNNPVVGVVAEAVVGSLPSLEPSAILKIEETHSLGGAQLVNEDNLYALPIAPGKDGGVGANKGNHVKNYGVITGEGYGMLADGVKHSNGHSTLDEKGGSSWHHENSTVENFNEIKTIGDVGMGAINGGHAINKGTIENIGNFGMLADGKEHVKPEYDKDKDGDYYSHDGGETFVEVPWGSYKEQNGHYVYDSKGTHDLSKPQSHVTNLADIRSGNPNNYTYTYYKYENGKLVYYSGRTAPSLGGNNIYKTSSISSQLVVDSNKRYEKIHNGLHEHSLAINHGVIQNTLDIGMGALNGGEVLNEEGGVIKNGKDIGMLALGEGEDCDETPSLAINEGTIENGNPEDAETGRYGMLAAEGGHAINKGLIQNTNDYGMVAISELTSENSKSGNHDHEGTLVRNEESGEIRNNGKFGMLASGENAKAENEGLVANLGDYGMVALDGAHATNEGTVQNEGNFGMVAVGTDTDGLNELPEADTYQWNHDERTMVKNEYNGKILGDTLVDDVLIAGVKEVGMAAFGNALAVNEGLIANSGDYGMYAENGATVINRGSNYTVEETEVYGDRPDERTMAGIYNEGNFGMVANAAIPENPELTEAELTLAANFGLVSNAGDYGMLAVNEGALALNIGESQAMLSSGGSHYTHGHGVVQNEGNFGMAAVNGGVGLNNGLIQNTGDVGMIATGTGSIVVNTEKSLNEIFSSDELEGIEDKLEKDYEHKRNQGDELPKLGIYNGGNFGMVAQNGALAINDGIIENAGNVGMLVYDKSLGVNTKNGVIAPNYDGVAANEQVGVYVLGSSAFINNGTIDGGEGYAIYGGSGNNAIYLGTDSNITGKVDGSGGTNVLYFLNGDEGDDCEEKVTKNVSEYGDVVANSFSHIAVAGTRTVTGGSTNGVEQSLGEFTGDYDLNGDNDGTNGNYTLTIDKDLDLRTSLNTTHTDYNSVNGVITSDKFNSLEVEGKELEGFVNGERYTGDLVIGLKEGAEEGSDDGATVTLKLAQNRVSVLAANTLKTENGGKVVQQALNQLFVTNANRIEITNILLNEEQLTEQLTELGNDTGLNLVADYNALGWDVEFVQNDDGSITTVFTRNGLGGSPLAGLGGFQESIDKYTQSNVDLLNASKIRDAGYMYARKAAFLPKTTVVEEQILPPAPLDKPSSKEHTASVGKESVPAPVKVAEPAVIRTETTSQYGNLQFGEMFGEAGEYDGNTNSGFDYNTWGATGATFHRFNDNWLAGASYGYASSDVDYTKGSEDVDSLGVDGFVSYQKDNWLVTGNLGYSWSKHKLNRSAFDNDSLVDSTIIGENHMSAKFDSHMINLGAEVGYNYALDNTSYLYPYVGFDYTWYTRDSYKEDGAGNLALSLDETDYGLPVSKLGVMYENKLSDKWTVTADLAWKHTFTDNVKEAKTLANFHNLNSDDKFEISGLDLGKDLGYVQLALDYDVTPQLTVGADYTGYFRDGQVGNKGGVNFKYKW